MLVPVGKGIELDVGVTRFNKEVMDHIVKTGLRNLIMDSHASATQKADPTGYIAKSRELAERKLQSLYDGVVRTQAIGGPKAPTDPVAMVILRLARKAVQKDKAEELAAASKGDRLALLNKFAIEYAEARDTQLRPRAIQIVRLENDEPEAPPAKAAIKKKAA
jgi:hypothetical protein